MFAWYVTDTVDAHQPELSGRVKEMPQSSRSKGEESKTWKTAGYECPDDVFSTPCEPASMLRGAPPSLQLLVTGTEHLCT